MHRTILILFACTLATVPGHSRADMIAGLPADPSRTDEYAGGNFWGNGLNLTGVGNTAGTAGTGQWGTLISPSFFVTASHYPPSGSLTFTNAAGVSYTFAIASETSRIAGTDLMLGMLATPVPASDGITPYSIAPPLTAANLGQPIFSMGVPYRFGENVISGLSSDVQGATVQYTFTGLATALPYESYLVAGDSGGPSFVSDTHGNLALVGTHWFDSGPVAPGAVSGDTDVTQLFAQIDAAMAATGSSERATLFAPGVPEPSSLALAGVGFALAWLWGRRASRRVIEEGGAR